MTSNEFLESPSCECFRPRGLRAWGWRLMWGTMAAVALCGTFLFGMAVILAAQTERTLWNASSGMFLVFGILFAYWAQFFVRKWLLWFRFRLSVVPEGIRLRFAVREVFVPWENLAHLFLSRSPVLEDWIQVSSRRDTLVVQTATPGPEFRMHGPLILGLFRKEKEAARLYDALSRWCPQFERGWIAEEEPHPAFEALILEDLHPFAELRPHGFWAGIRIHCTRLFVILANILLTGTALAIFAQLPEEARSHGGGILAAVWAVAELLLFLFSRSRELNQLWRYSRKWRQTRLFLGDEGIFFQNSERRLAFPWSESAVEISWGDRRRPVQMALLRSDGQCAVLSEELLNSFGKDLLTILPVMEARLRRQKSF